MDRYIKRDDVYALFGKSGMANLHVADIDVIQDADVVSVVHGRWLDGKCTRCAWEIPDSVNYTGYEDEEWVLTNFCPNCGAKMGE